MTKSMINKEREKIRKQQSNGVMPLIGRLLDVWDDLPNDCKADEEFKGIANVIQEISEIMEGENNVKGN